MVKLNLTKYLTPKVVTNLFVMLGFLVFILLLLTALGREVREQSSSLQSIKGEIGARITAVSQLAELREDAKQAAPALEKLRQVLPERDELFSFSRYLENLGKEDGLTIAFSFSGTETEPTETTPGSSGFKVTALGPYQGILNFIQKLEQGSFSIKLDSVDIGLDKEGYKGTVYGSVFFYD